MSNPMPQPVLARLRASARLAMLVLLLFAMKIGVAAACVPHDFGDLKNSVVQGHALVSQAPSSDGDGNQSPATFGHAATCNHCGCQHGSAVPPASLQTSAALTFERLHHRIEASSSPSLRLELRPPII